jgi:hypothetical protein
MSISEELFVTSSVNGWKKGKYQMMKLFYIKWLKISDLIMHKNILRNDDKYFKGADKLWEF